MNTRRTTSGMLGLMLAFGLTGGLSAVMGESGTTGQSANQLLLNANTLIGNTVIDQSGKELGTVKDLLIDQSNGQITYIILSYGGTFGGTLGIGTENYSIPWQEVKLTKQDDKMIIQVAEAPIGERAKPEEHASTPNQPAIATRTMGFNPATVETMEGTVDNVGHDMLEPGVATGDSVVALDVKTATGKERVQIAPDNFLQSQSIEIKEGDKIEFTGSRITRDEESVLLASKITLKDNGKVLALRQDDGTPMWAFQDGIHTKSQSAPH